MPPLRATANVVRFRAGRYFNARLTISMPAYSDWAALVFADLSTLATGRGHLEHWAWPPVETEAELAASMGHALVELGLPCWERNLSLEGLRRTIEGERGSPNRTQYRALVREQLGQ